MIHHTPAINRYIGAIRHLARNRCSATSIRQAWIGERLSTNAVIVGGCGRSGTTLLASLVGAHPQIYLLPTETRAFCPLNYSIEEPRPLKPRWNLLLRHIDAAHVESSMSGYCEKTPKNIQNARRILDFIGPQGRFIHIVRDGRDVVLSRHPSRSGFGWVSPQRWVDDVAAGLAIQSDSRVFTVRYEDLVTEPEVALDRIQRFCGLPTVNLVELYINAPHLNASEQSAWGQAAERQLPNTQSIGHWRVKSRSRDVLALNAIPEAHRLLAAYGYE